MEGKILLRDWLKEQRIARGGLTQEQLAAALKVDTSQIRRIEGGHGLPSVELLQRIADYFGIDVADIPSAQPSGTALSEIASSSKGGRREPGPLLGVIAGVLVTIAVVGVALIVGLLRVSPTMAPLESAGTPLASAQASATQAPPAPTPTPMPVATPTSEPGTVIRIPPGAQPVPPLPERVEFAPDARWKNGDVLRIHTDGGDGAYLRPYPIADNKVAEYLAALSEDTRVEIASNFRWQVQGEYWWYLRVANPQFTNRPLFGWIREDYLQAVPSESSGG